MTTNMKRNREGLQERVSRWRAALAAADTGPLAIAADVVRLADEWKEHEAEAGGVSCTTWLRKTLGKGRSLAWFETRARAVESLGESVRRTLHHEVAVWLVNNAPQPTWKAVVEALMFARKRNGGNALTLAQAKPIARQIIGIAASPRRVSCMRCQRLEKQLKENGIAVE